jgi:hypothetical protein
MLAAEDAPLVRIQPRRGIQSLGRPHGAYAATTSNGL